MEVRKATIKDSNKILSLWEKFILEHEKSFGKENLKKDFKKIFKNILERKIKSPNSTILILTENNLIMGFISASIEKEFPIYKEKKIGFIEDIFIDKKFRKKHYSKRLMGEIMNWFSKKSIQNISMKINIKNKKALKIANKNKFAPKYIQLNKL